MARSGAGNVDSHTASDYVGDLVERLAQEVEQALSKPTRMQTDEYCGEIVP